MSIFGAMNTAVSGLQAQGYALENVSGNIANSQTIGFKRVDTSFADLIPDSPARHEIAGSVTTNSQLTNTIQGGLKTTGVATNMAINGEGYFVVAQKTGSTNGQAVFSGTDFYTRRGDFALDKNGYLVNGGGYVLTGFPVDFATGNVTSSEPKPIQISQQPIPAGATSEITYTANLPISPATASASASTPGSELLAAPGTGSPAFPAGYDPRILATPAPAGSGFVAGQDQGRFLGETIPGGSVTAYDKAGNPINVQMRWGKVANGDPNATPATPDVWNLFYQQDSTATGNDPAWQNVGAPVTFDGTGRMTAPSGNLISIPNFTIGTTQFGAVAINLGPNGLTQYASPNGLVSALDIQQNGYPSGSLNSISVSGDGGISGFYSNGRVVTVAQVAVGQFKADDALKRMDGGVYAQTIESGVPSIGLGQSSISGGSVENSNVDIADEFSKLIVTQQAYSANTKVLTTSQQMMTDVINIIR